MKVEKQGEQMEKRTSGYDNYRQGNRNVSRQAPRRSQNNASGNRSANVYGQAPSRRSSGGPGSSGGSRASGGARSAAAGQRRNQRQAPYNRKRRRRRRRSGITLFLILFLILVLVCGAGAAALYWSGQNKESGTSAGNKQTGFLEKITNTVKSSKAPEVAISLESLDSPYAIMIDADTGTVIGSKQGEVKIFPASMAKIMTVLTAIDHIDDLNQKITMSYDYYDTLYEQDASRAGFEPGEDAVIRDLLYGAILPSGAECCMELALQAAGSEEAFAELMNQKAQEIGLTQTHFTNCTGLHDENQYSTPQEIALILREALDNKTFREVFTTHSYSVKPSNVHAEGFTFWSTMFKNMQAENVIGGEILGGKTGYTQAAGYCLASMAEVEGREYIQVTAGWASNPRVNLYHINDAFLGYNTLGRALAELKE